MIHYHKQIGDTKCEVQNTNYITKQNDSLNCNLIISTKAQFNHSIFISQIMTIHKSKLSYKQCYHKLISTSYLIFQDCHSEQTPQTTQVSSALELTLLTSEVIFVTIFGMAGMNLGTSVSAATHSASKFRAGNNVYHKIYTRFKNDSQI
ncbi:Hypothetical_protein [Hexamita inflata]|uniref:Hypothetical_protein n=1 Tax=Hexamita inflata TaxID=28002 RepID=A0ABP1IZ33_9EUKA